MDTKELYQYKVYIQKRIQDFIDGQISTCFEQTGIGVKEVRVVHHPVDTVGNPRKHYFTTHIELDI